MIESAADTRIAVPSASMTLAYRENTLTPGPIVDCAMSTGAMLPDCKMRTASGSSVRRAAMNSPRVAIAADADRGRHASTIDEAKAFVPRAIMRPGDSVRIGQVAVTCKPASNTAWRNVSQPVVRTSPSLDSVAL